MNCSVRRQALRVFWGDQGLGSLAGEMDRRGCQRPILVTGPTLSRDETVIQSIQNAAGRQLVDVFAGVRPHTPVAAVTAGAEAMSRSGADGVVVVGGGSAMVTARAATILLAEGEPLIAHSTTFGEEGSVESPRLRQPKIPIFVLPTTPTTASAKAGSAVTVDGMGSRAALFDPKTRAAAVLVDPGLVMTAPRELVMTAALDAYVMAIEGLCSRAANVFSEAPLVHAAKGFATLLPHFCAGNDGEDLRTRLVLLAILVGEGTDITGGGAAAALSHTLGWQLHQSNGTIGAIILPHRLAWDARHRPEILAGLAGQDLDVLEHAARVSELLGAAASPTRLRDLGLASESLPRCAADAMNDFAARTDTSCSTAMLLEILRHAW